MEEETVDFTERELRLIARALPMSADQDRLALLEQIMRDWGRVDLPRLFKYTPDTPQVRNKRRNRCKQVEVAAKQLVGALAALDSTAKWELVIQLACPPDIYPQGLTAATIEKARNDLGGTPSLLQTIAAAAQAAGEAYAGKKGRARNNVGYLILMDLAEIFEWVVGIEATRRVDRITSEDSGPFHAFASAVWSTVFRGDEGLSNGLKEWAAGRKNFSERSPVLGNLHLRHPEWGIFR